MNKMDSPQSNTESHRVFIYLNADSRRFSRIKKICVNPRESAFSLFFLCETLCYFYVVFLLIDYYFIIV